MRLQHVVGLSARLLMVFEHDQGMNRIEICEREGEARGDCKAVHAFDALLPYLCTAHVNTSCSDSFMCPATAVQSPRLSQDVQHIRCLHITGPCALPPGQAIGGRMARPKSTVQWLRRGPCQETILSSSYHWNSRALYTAMYHAVVVCI